MATGLTNTSWAPDVGGYAATTGAPATTPSFAGQLAFDSANFQLYIATGTSSSADWKVVAFTHTGNHTLAITTSANTAVTLPTTGTLATTTQVDTKVTGPASAVNDAFARFDGTTGKLIKEGTGRISDIGIITQVSIDADANNITNIENADIKAAAAIDATKIANGSVDNTEFQRLNSAGTAGAGNLVTTDGTQTITNKTITVLDTAFTIQDNATPAAQARFQVGDLTTTRVITAPDADITLVGTTTAQSLSNKTIGITNNITVLDNAFTIQDEGNSARQIIFELAGLTTVRTLTPPDANITLVGTTSTQTLTNKTLDSDTVSTLLSFSNQAAARFAEQSGNGTNYIALSAPDVVTTTATLKLPDGVGSSGQFLKTDGASPASLSWDTPAGAQDSVFDAKNYSIATSVAANALTIALKDKTGADPSGGSTANISFRSSTATSGVYNVRSVSSALSMTVSSGSTLGHVSGEALYAYIYAIDNAGTVELAVSAKLFDDGSIVSTTAEGGAGGADTFSVMYSTTARTNVPCRLLGRFLSTQATAGTWAAVPTETTSGVFEHTETGVFTVNFNSGMRTGTNNVTVRYRKSGGMVTLVLPQVTVTANATAANWTTSAGIPPQLRPISLYGPRIGVASINNGAQDSSAATAEITSVGEIDVTRSSTWTSGTVSCGFQAFSVTYPVS